MLTDKGPPKKLRQKGRQAHVKVGYDEGRDWTQLNSSQKLLSLVIQKCA